MDDLVEIIPINQRAHNRVNEHGNIMRLLDIKTNGSLLVESIERTWNKNTEYWRGWFDTNEATYELLDD